VELPDRLILSPVPKIGICAATGVGDVRVDGGDEMSELTSLGGGAIDPDIGGDGLGEVRDPNWRRKIQMKVYSKYSSLFSSQSLSM
jgi:hypothetical protein